MIGNAIVGQSGGPTSVINATLSGVIRGVASDGKIKKLYGMRNGIEGFSHERIIDLSYLFDNENELNLLESTPSSVLGSCRKRLPSYLEDEKTYKDLFKLFEKYNIRYFFYIGGNDSMDTVMKISEYSEKCNYKVNVIGIPKTIDNDLAITDHTPGYGSASKFIATTIQEIACDTACYLCNAVTIVEIMGRDAGWLTASAGLPKYFGNRGADLIYLPEVYFDDDKFITSLNKLLLKKPNVLVAISEGIRYSDGTYVGESNQSGVTDVFGHKYLSGSSKTLEQLVKEKIGCKVRSVELNLPQRCSSHISSETDVKESVEIGKYAVDYATKGMNGKMAVFKRKNTEEYEVEFSCEDICKIANKVKFVPREFINQEENYVTEECMKYIAPLIQGERNIKCENGLPVHFKLQDK
ncbi:MAG: 6-phosphofructokinase, partial [Clostridia bacterium]|nr:6-phosphofructokinase [Clostridia bacterium]